MTQQNDIVVDHWWDRPLSLSCPEIDHIVCAASDLIGLQLKCDTTAAPPGRSGAALIILTAVEGHTRFFARVTSVRRSSRELYAIANLECAAHLRLPHGRGGCALPQVTRPFPTAMTLVPYIEGDPCTAQADLCGLFSDLFESSRTRDLAKAPRAAWRPLVGLLEVLPATDHQYVMAALKAVERHRWSATLGHGDPHPSNVIHSTRFGYLPVDFASGGVVTTRLHRARWANAIHRPGQPSASTCAHCAAALGDELSLLIDGARRLRSDYGDPVRTAFWMAQVQKLLRTAAA